MKLHKYRLPWIAFAPALLICCLYGAPRLVSAAPDDIVPSSSSLLDAFAVLAKSNSLVGKTYTPFDFTGSRLWSRGELAEIIAVTVLKDSASLAKVEASKDEAAAFRSILVQLRPELKLDGFDADALAKATASGEISFDLLGKIEGRSNSEADQNKDHQLASGTYGIYRGTVQGDISPSVRFAVSVSNQAEDDRRYFDNDLGPHDFSALKEAYLEFEGRSGLQFDVGREADRWGPGYRGATMLSDNSPAFDQARIAFPFSLGERLGRSYTFEQMATAFSESGGERYLETRRIGYQFSSHWQFNLGEAFKAGDSKALLYTPIPFDIGQGIHLNTGQNQFNYQLNSGLTYSASATSRLYGQFFVDDIKSPFNSGSFLGFSLGRHEFIPRKIAYLVGSHTELESGTALTLEYDFADPNTYTYRNNAGIWQHGQFDWIGLPAGPNSREVYGRIDQRIGKPITLSLEYRDRWRDGLSWISPTARNLAVEGDYQLGNRDSLGLVFDDYRQDPYPFVPGAAGSPGVNIYAPTNQGYIGQKLRANELDFSYSHIF